MSREQLYVMRNEILRNGLLEMIGYINEDTPTKGMKMIEIGSYAGESTTIFASSFKEVLAIDPFLNDYDLNDITCHYMELNKVYNVFSEAISGHGNIRHIMKTSDEASSGIKDDSYDFVYIDGLHTYEQVKKDITNYLPKIKKGGFIGGHDYHPNWQGVMDAINELLVVERVFGDTSWIVKVK
jgi:predicted O-methyltransferase YrrM